MTFQKKYFYLEYTEILTLTPPSLLLWSVFIHVFNPKTFTYYRCRSAISPSSTNGLTVVYVALGKLPNFFSQNQRSFAPSFSNHVMWNRVAKQNACMQSMISFTTSVISHRSRERPLKPENRAYIIMASIHNITWIHKRNILPLFNLYKYTFRKKREFDMIYFS